MTEAALNMKFMEMAKLLNIYLNHFPRHEKYALANRIRNTAYEVYDLISEGQKRYFKKTTLTSLDIAHEKLRMQIFLAYELGYFRFKDGRRAEKGQKQNTAYTNSNARLKEAIRQLLYPSWDTQSGQPPFHTCLKL